MWKKSHIFFIDNNQQMWYNKYNKTREDKTMTAQEIRKELADHYGYEDARKVCCYNCKYWGFNCGKVLNSQSESRCTKRKKEWTWASQYCRGFALKSEK